MPSTLAPGPLFIVSMWRAGSSLIYALLNKHPQVALMYESDLVLLRPLFIKSGWKTSWAERWEFWNTSISRHNIDLDAIPPGICSLRTAFEAAYQQVAVRKSAAIWGDKTPNYYDQLNRLATYFPQAHFIIVWRNPADSVNSMIRAAALGNSYFRKRGMALRALVGYGVFKQECDRLIERNIPVCQVNYEDLVNDTPGTMKQVCEFLGIPYHDELATLEGADRSATHAGAHHSLLRADKIVAKPRPDVVDPMFRKKVHQYASYWRGIYKGNWPSFPRADEDVVPPSSAQRFLDQVRYRLFRIFDAFTALSFCFAPVWLLRRYRKEKRKRLIDITASPDGPRATPRGRETYRRPVL
jgi:sulfotransferase family protein